AMPMIGVPVVSVTVGVMARLVVAAAVAVVGVPVRLVAMAVVTVGVVGGCLVTVGVMRRFGVGRLGRAVSGLCRDQGVAAAAGLVRGHQLSAGGGPRTIGQRHGHAAHPGQREKGDGG